MVGCGAKVLVLLLDQLRSIGMGHTEEKEKSSEDAPGANKEVCSS